MGTPIRRGRGRRPADEVRAEILTAAGELLLEEGMAGFTVEKVAERAGASRVTVHKWWPSRGALAFDGYFAATSPVLAFPDTGDIEADLRSQLRNWVRLATRTSAGRVVRELLGAAQTDGDLMAAWRERYSGPRRALAVQRLDAAKAAGQLRKDVDSEGLVDQLWGACYHRLLIPDLPLTEQFADRLVDTLFQGVRGEAAAPSPLREKALGVPPHR
ncbi:TetR/AcrR family transcriptional regulator [Rugosimonospora acidiphila]|uniref:TetR/AcrR family transcriptional regulator n=1 Tax=Rugosimonospora acidiphila TaxID=556531 RepID=A0ABP9SEP6_9ACTN